MSAQKLLFSPIFPIVFSGLFSSVDSSAAPVSFQNSMLHVITDVPDKNTGLDNIFVIYDTKGVDMVYSTSNSSNVKIYKYSNLGGGYAEEITSLERNNDSVILHDIEGNLGYIIEEGSNRYYCWIVEYLPYRFSIKSITASDDIECDATVLDVDGYAAPIYYFTINGQQRELGRDITVTYDTQKFDKNVGDFTTVSSKTILSSFENRIRLSPASLAYTSFIIKGDRFLQDWKWGVEAESIVIAPHAVSIVTDANQLDDNSNNKPSQDDSSDSESSDEISESPSNQIKDDSSSLGGSAPADIEFSAYVSEGVLHYEWQMSRDPDFAEIEYRFNVQNLDYTFLEEGTYYVRFIGSNSDGSCEAIGDTYAVSIGASELLCPNAFSPDGDGVNDEWKVSYRSLIEFDCWIFDRYGAEICHFSDPKLGWDGKRNGKLVNPGVYFYVITAVGSDGKKYKKSGDINILRHRSGSSQGSTESE